LRNLSEIVARASNSTINPWQPIIGNNVFAHESGIHANGTLKNGSSFEPFSPDLVGGQRQIIIGKHSGSASINHALTHFGLEANDRLAAEILARVREVSMIKQGGLSYEDVKQLYYSCLNNA
jgi:isopropylmalate/homocitrate/citramalate synthase